MDLFITIIGICAAMISGYLSWRFWRVPAAFGRALSVMCAAECMAEIATVIFALTSVLGEYGQLPGSVVIGLRLMIFLPMTGSSLYMLKTVQEAENGRSD